jgi:hypothetical protein
VHLQPGAGIAYAGSRAIAGGSKVFISRVAAASGGSGSPAGSSSTWTGCRRSGSRRHTLCAYDPNSNLVTFTDRKGQVTSYQYDGLNRRTFAGFGTTV